MISMAQFLVRYVTPLLKPLGFTKTGSTYRLIADNGDQALIEFQRSSGTDIAFFVNVAVSPKTQAEFLDYLMKRQPRAPSVAGAALSDRVRPPAEVEYDNGSIVPDQRWEFTDDATAQRCGELLAEILTRDVVPVIAPLLDRKNFLAYLARPKEDRPFKSARSSYVTVPLLIDEGPNPEMEAILAKAAAAGDMRVVDWAEQYLRDRRGSSAK